MKGENIGEKEVENNKEDNIERRTGRNLEIETE